MRPVDLRNLVPKLVGPEEIPDLVSSLRTLEVLAEYKYDEYQQFAPGHRFMESLVLWLSRIPPAQRVAALKLVRERLIFFSRADIFHFTKMAFPFKIRPMLLEWEARRHNIPMHRWVHFSRSASFELAVRRTLFLGLSDGAHLDDFRRQGGLHNDQVHASYHLPEARAAEMVNKLGEHIEKRRGTIEGEPYGVSLTPTFNRIVLVDDFTASGTSYIRKKDGGGWSGKIHTFLETLDAVEVPLVDWRELKSALLFYVATDRAKDHIGENLAQLNQERAQKGLATFEPEFQVVQPLSDDIALTPENAGDLRALIDGYDVEGTYDTSMSKGGPPDHQRWGFARCGLPVVLYHNSPNNSVAPLWMYRDRKYKMPGLFPRIRRHWDVT